MISYGPSRADQGTWDEQEEVTALVRMARAFCFAKAGFIMLVSLSVVWGPRLECIFIFSDLLITHIYSHLWFYLPLRIG